MKTTRRCILLTLIVAALLIAADQVLKYLVVRYLAPIGTAPLAPGIIGLRYIENTGAAFNFLRDQRVLLIVITGIALAALLLFLLLRRPKNRWEYLSLLMVFSGGTGNLIDRIAKGYVVDYLDFEFMEFAVFNFADILITTGFAILVVAIFAEEARARKQKKAQEAVEGTMSEMAPPEAKAGSADAGAAVPDEAATGILESASSTERRDGEL